MGAARAVLDDLCEDRGMTTEVSQWSPRTRLILILLAEFFISLGGTVTAAMIQAGALVWPRPLVFVYGAMVGIVAGWVQLKVMLLRAEA